jgi:hypothetical protein
MPMPFPATTDISTTMDSNSNKPGDEWLVRISDEGLIERRLNTVRVERSLQPRFLSPYEQEKWELEEIRRCIQGHGVMNGKMYFYFNHCWIKDNDRGKIQPDFRVCDLEWFELMYWATRRNKGVACVKRRRAGFTWKACADALHDAMFNNVFNVGINSKTEKDGETLFGMLKFMYSNLPLFLRATTTSNTASEMLFGIKEKDENGNWVLLGRQSQIVVQPPVPTTFEGRMLKKWISDESGKIDCLEQLFSYTQPCLYDGNMQRVGVPILFGTAGDVDGHGSAFYEIYMKAHAYDLYPYFFSGLMGFMCDEFGNDQPQKALAWIQENREKAKLKSQKDYNDFIQQYPLSLEEAFSQLDSVHKIDLNKVAAQIKDLHSNPPRAARGFFRFTGQGQAVEWVPSDQGMVTIFEHPDKGLSDGYLAGNDPTDTDDTAKGGSMMSSRFLKKPYGSEPARIVCAISYKPGKVNRFFEQNIMACLYYQARILVERNRGGRMIGYFEDNGFEHLLKEEPQKPGRVYYQRATRKGVVMNEEMIAQMTGLLEAYVDNYCEWINDLELLEDLKLFGRKNSDHSFAFGIALLHLRDDKSQVTDRADKKKGGLGFVYKKVNGRIERVKS